MYQWRKGIAQWSVGKKLYLSVPFTWLLDEANRIATEWKGESVIGGPALMEPNTCEGFEPILFHNPCATFTTRGCPNNCPFCAVPYLEGDLVEVPNFRPAPVICDNNLLASSRKHLERVVDKLKVFPLVDFNQGLEARRFAPEVADLLGNIKCHVRFAFDHWGQEAAVKDAIDLCRERTTKDIGVYCLIGYNDNLEEAKSKLELIRSWGVLPYPMRYQPLDAKVKNEYVNPKWTDRQLRNVIEYYSRLNWRGYRPFEELRSNRKSIPKEQLEFI